MSNALIVVDMQNDFCEGGALPVAGGHRLAEAIAAMPTWGDYDRHFASLDWHDDGVSNGGHFDEWPAHCVAFTTGAAFVAPLSPSRFDAVVTKGFGYPAYSAFEGVEHTSDIDSLDSMLRQEGIEEVTVVGLALDYCVKATALDAAKHGYTTTVLLDYTEAVDPTRRGRVVTELEAAGVIVR